jgi:hypothetical protein
MMDTRRVIIRMLKQLLEDMMVLHQQGAGYYSCIPIIRRYNKLLGQAATLFPQGDGLIQTFDPMPEKDPKDPADKMIEIQAIRVEIGQLISLLESQEEGPA